MIELVDLRKYAKRLQDRLGETKSADEIIEGSWLNVVVSELNQMSMECAKELQQETGMIYRKPATENKPGYDLGFDQAPPTRLLALGLILAYWLGWIDNEKDLDDMPVNAWNRLCEAYIAGRSLSEEHKIP